MGAFDYLERSDMVMARLLICHDLSLRMMSERMRFSYMSSTNKNDRQGSVYAAGAASKVG